MIVLVSGAIFSVVYLTKADREAKVIVTNFPAYDICRHLLGPDDDNILMLDNASSDMHSYNPTAGDIAKISKSELFICVGGTSDDKWLSDIIRSANNTNLKVLEMIDLDGVNRLEENDENILENDHHHEHDHEHNHDHEDNEEIHEEIYDEHMWLSIKNMIKVTQHIEESLILVFPQKQELIKSNAREYIDNLQELDREYIDRVSNKSKSIVIADRFPFRYLVEDYNINYFALFSGCSTETEAKAETIIKLNNKITETATNYIFTLESSNKDIANNCKSKFPNLEILELNSCQFVKADQAKNISYYDIMLKNLENIEKAITL